VGKVVRTEHPHIVKAEGVCGGRPTIEGTRISVDFIARFLRGGTDPVEIAAMYPNVTLASVYDAVSYYFDHQDEIETLIDDGRPEYVLASIGAYVDKTGKVVCGSSTR